MTLFKESQTIFLTPLRYIEPIYIIKPLRLQQKTFSKQHDQLIFEWKLSMLIPLLKYVFDLNETFPVLKIIKHYVIAPFSEPIHCQTYENAIISIYNNHQVIFKAIA